MAGLQKERKEQEKNSTQQEKRITDYKQKVSTLKKFKHVLDFRLREVPHAVHILLAGSDPSLIPKLRQIGCNAREHMEHYAHAEVSESLMPKERQIEQLKAQLQDTEGEFEKQLSAQQHLQQTLELRNQKIAQLQDEVPASRAGIVRVPYRTIRMKRCGREKQIELCEKDRNTRSTTPTTGLKNSIT